MRSLLETLYYGNLDLKEEEGNLQEKKQICNRINGLETQIEAMLNDEGKPYSDNMLTLTTN